MSTQQAPGGTARLGPHTVARIGLGVMQLGERGSDENAVAVLREAVELGVDHLDTAQFYGDGTANRRIHQALHPYDDGLAIVTKVGAERVGEGLVAAQRPEQLRQQVEANLATLGTERLALVNLRRMDFRPGIVAEGEQVVPIEDQLAELIALRDEGKVEAIGLSHVDRATLKGAADAGIACVQDAHSLLDRTFEDVLDACRERGIAWVPFFPLGSAFAALPKVTDDPRVRTVAEEVGATPAQVGLAWELAHYEGTLLIPGTADLAHLRDNLVHVELTEEQVARLSSPPANAGSASAAG